jgi:hypothetical protein
MIRIYEVDTCMGKVIGGLPCLNHEQNDKLNEIGYTGKGNREIYLNSLNIGEFKVKKTKSDSGDFCESFTIVFVPKG